MDSFYYKLVTVMGQTKGFIIILGFALFAGESFLFSDNEI